MDPQDQQDQPMGSSDDQGQSGTPADDGQGAGDQPMGGEEPQAPSEGEGEIAPPPPAEDGGMGAPAEGDNSGDQSAA